MLDNETTIIIYTVWTQSAGWNQHRISQGVSGCSLQYCTTEGTDVTTGPGYGISRIGGVSGCSGRRCNSNQFLDHTLLCGHFHAVVGNYLSNTQWPTCVHKIIFTMCTPNTVQSSELKYYFQLINQKNLRWPK